MTYKTRFARYEIRIGGVCYKWFKSLEKAEAEYEELAEAMDEIEDTLELVNSKTGEVLASAEPEEAVEAVEEEEKASAEKTIADMIIEAELPALEYRLEKLIELNAPTVMIEGQRKAVEDLKAGILKVGGNKEKLANVVDGYEIRKGNGRKQYMLFSDGTMYFPNARYGRYIK